MWLHLKAVNCGQFVVWGAPIVESKAIGQCHFHVQWIDRLNLYHAGQFFGTERMCEKLSGIFWGSMKGSVVHDSFEWGCG